jgi:hypothetical protein
MLHLNRIKACLKIILLVAVGFVAMFLFIGKSKVYLYYQIENQTDNKSSIQLWVDKNQVIDTLIENDFPYTHIKTISIPKGFRRVKIKINSDEYKILGTSFFYWKNHYYRISVSDSNIRYNNTLNYIPYE